MMRKPPPVVDLLGVLMFIAGLAAGGAQRVGEGLNGSDCPSWLFFLVLGLVRMFAASQYRRVTHAPAR